MSKSKNQEPGITWREPDGRPVSCEEKLAMLNENLDEIREYCQEAFEDALLMGCDEDRSTRFSNPYSRPFKTPTAARKTDPPS